MKTKQYLLTVVVGTATLGLGMWVYYSKQGFLSSEEIFMFAALLLVAFFAIFLGIRRFKSTRRGEPAEDELSKLILLKAGATSFHMSLYFWLALSYIISEKDISSESAIGIGIIGMAVIFGLSWFYHRLKGLQD